MSNKVKKSGNGNTMNPLLTVENSDIQSINKNQQSGTGNLDNHKVEQFKDNFLSQCRMVHIPEVPDEELKSRLVKAGAIISNPDFVCEKYDEARQEIGINKNKYDKSQIEPEIRKRTMCKTIDAIDDCKIITLTNTEGEKLVIPIELFDNKSPNYVRYNDIRDEVMKYVKKFPDFAQFKSELSRSGKKKSKKEITELFAKELANKGMLKEVEGMVIERVDHTNGNLIDDKIENYYVSDWFGMEIRMNNELRSAIFNVIFSYTRRMVRYREELNGSRERNDVFVDEFWKNQDSFKEQTIEDIDVYGLSSDEE